MNFPQQPLSRNCGDDTFKNLNFEKYVDGENWKEGRRPGELVVLLSSQKTCTFCT